MNSYSKSLRGLLSLLVATTLFSACVGQQTELPFETIEQAVGTIFGVERYEEEEPKMVVVISSDEISSLSPNISPQARPELSNTDFGFHFIVAVFQGLKSSFDYEVNIERIVQSGETVKVYARFEEPGPILRPAQSSPYHVVRVEKPPELSGKEVQIILVANGKEISDETHQFP